MECETDTTKLICEILNGKPEVFEQIVLQYQNLIYTMCLNLVHNKHDAENMAQETFLAAYCSLADFKNENFKSWICKIAVNKCIDFKRKQKKRLNNEENFELNALTAKNSIDVESQVEKNERFEKLHNVLSQIPNKYIAVIKAHYFEEMTVKEIATRQNIAEKTIETQLYRAKKLIKKKWGNEDDW